MSLLPLLLLPAAAAPLVSWDLESDDGGFVSGGETGQWEWGVVDSGPGAGSDGSRAWATVLSGAHRNDAVDTLTLPAWRQLALTVRPSSRREARGGRSQLWPASNTRERS